MPNAAFRDRLDEVCARIEERRQRGGWRHAVRVIAVTKTHGAEAVREAAAAGLVDVGENRVQEALDKQELVGAVPLRWHLIGALQRRKARQAVGRFAVIHSVDRMDLATELARRVAPGTTQVVLVQVNCSAEPQKGGVEPTGLSALLDALRDVTGIEVRGLMTMASWGADERELHRTFGQLRTLRDRAESAGHALPELSMGMSDDYAVAVEEGATMVRLGTVLFGTRHGAI
jgi:pyridoxal phosphate enzyme (YggS family)